MRLQENQNNERRHTVAMNNTKVNVGVEWKKCMNMSHLRDTTPLVSNKIELQLELRNRFETLQERDVIVTFMGHQSATKVV